MFQYQGIWLPDGEKHFPEWMARNGELVDGKGTYQIRKFREAMKWCRTFDTAVDVGGHVGLWSMHLAKRFRNVFAYEPVRAFRECYMRNVDPGSWENRAIAEGWGRGGAQANVELFPYALGATPSRVDMAIDPADSGGTHVICGGSVEMVTLDDQFLHVPDAISFLKIDCEGYELPVLMGATELLRVCRPCIIVEQKPHKLKANYGYDGAPAVDYLTNIGAKVRAELSGDFILSWD